MRENLYQILEHFLSNIGWYIMVPLIFFKIIIVRIISHTFLECFVMKRYISTPLVGCLLHLSLKIALNGAQTSHIRRKNASKSKIRQNPPHNPLGGLQRPRPPAVITRYRRFAPYARLARFARKKTAGSTNFPYFDP